MIFIIALLTLVTEYASDERFYVLDLYVAYAMEIGPDVTLWRGGVEDQDERPELGPASYLFEASTIAFSALLQVVVGDPTHFDSELYQTLREEFRKFYLWNEGFCTGSGDLDQILSSSKNLKATVLGLMVLWARALSKGMILKKALRRLHLQTF